ncbi:MAG: hypothetical protein IKI21_11650 [Oscillospiraceae bacterium]|nr:hypothetical protein [Oscillospiraceae bacterium]
MIAGLVFLLLTIGLSVKYHLFSLLRYEFANREKKEQEEKNYFYSDPSAQVERPYSSETAEKLYQDVLDNAANARGAGYDDQPHDVGSSGPTVLTKRPPVNDGATVLTSRKPPQEDGATVLTSRKPPQEDGATVLTSRKPPQGDGATVLTSRKHVQNDDKSATTPAPENDGVVIASQDVQEAASDAFVVTESILVVNGDTSKVLQYLK